MLVTVASGLGLHVGDLPVIGLWVAALVCGVLLWREQP